MKRIQKIMPVGVLVMLVGCATNLGSVHGSLRRDGATYSYVGSGERALAWLAHQQNRDGSWGEKPENRPELTGLVLIAFISLGEYPASETHGDQVRRGLEKAVEYAKDIKLDANSRSILLCALAEGWDVTLNPLLRDAVLDLLAKLDGAYSPLWISRALRTSQMKRQSGEVNCRLKKCGKGFEGKSDLYNQVCHAYCSFGIDRHWIDELDELGNLKISGWRLASRPLLTRSMLCDLLYYRGGQHEDLRREMVKDIMLRQYIKREVPEEGWWTADGFGVPDDPDAKRFSGIDKAVYVTAVTVPALWWGSVRPAPTHDSVENPRPEEETDPDDVRIDTGNL